MMETQSKKVVGSIQTQQFSELAIYLLSTNKVIYQTIILVLFEGLNWPDSLCCFRLIQIGSSLVDKYTITCEPNPQKFTLTLNPQTAQQLFTCCLTALQIHGEHQDAASQLTNLALIIYDRSPLDYKRGVYYRVLEQIPEVNRRTLDEFTMKSCVADSTSSSSSSPPKRASSSSLHALTTNEEKMRKDAFKKMLQPIVGKSLGQLYKQEILIRQLEPLNLKTKRRMNAENAAEAVKNGAEVNIYSLFDPANN